MPKRPGEMELAENCLSQDAWLSFIGHIQTPFKSREMCPRNGRGTDEVAYIKLKPEFLPGVKSLETCSHVIVFYWMHHAMRTLIQQRPKFDTDIHGTFALRSPNRPNPIAISVVELLEIQPDGLKIRYIDCLDGTPLLDIKPYFPHTDAIPDAQVGWFDKATTPDPI
ncbi:tRNA (N6-threonylcarbamoyladenosine(37)-N6)-methyltransferase TrmO [Cohaesibacter celericrescens]|uniref:tRNA (N6-threonylcarbamoyladenosine(37)-N6)-methyltransferase TrmO n=1 Tax=Cohaesibacter celericrescens TaxID=2067669 RepID=A0A2N5XWY6_9HYPH|nr:tRNA (N6-threonylcarbamoyladenosine(37)-N6)-methyltransferase TrmO [Cohaesibacter celericrescens]PLW79026.1 tRNA (N6-threonylcarbamoyladenosine(37)-N6)-methyltransferase TrmO [Cohaesibacter celericrescens]